VVAVARETPFITAFNDEDGVIPFFE